jgi:hypothetical protein
MWLHPTPITGLRHVSGVFWNVKQSTDWLELLEHVCTPRHHNTIQHTNKNFTFFFFFFFFFFFLLSNGGSSVESVVSERRRRRSASHQPTGRESASISPSPALQTTRRNIARIHCRRIVASRQHFDALVRAHAARRASASLGAADDRVQFVVEQGRCSAR